MKKRLQILIVDDSTLVRTVLRELLESDPEIEVVGEACNGREALLRAGELQPDVITMDVRMPVMDGLETTSQLMAYNPTPVLAITALYSRDDVDISFKMLGAGALEVMEKPDLSDPDARERARRELIQRVKLLARVRVVTHLRGRRRVKPGKDEAAETWRVRRKPAPAPAVAPGEPDGRAAKKPARQHPPPSTTQPPEPVAAPIAPAKPKVAPAQRPPRVKFPLVVIGASTGGPRVVQQILKSLPNAPGASIVVVQHIAEGFSAGMVEWLANNCVLPVRLACEGERLTVNTVLVAPDSFHLYVQEQGKIHLDNESPLQRPSVDLAMQSAATIFGSQTIGVLLTGMGRDGADGMRDIHLAGGYTIAQDEASCSIYGMPRAAVELGVVDEIVSPDNIVPTIQRHLVGNTT